MPIEINCNVFSIETYSGKNGLGANVVLLNQTERGKLEVNLAEEKLIQSFVKLEGKNVTVLARLNQNKFGTRVEVIEVMEVA